MEIPHPGLLDLLVSVHMKGHGEQLSLTFEPWVYFRNVKSNFFFFFPHVWLTVIIKTNTGGLQLNSFHNSMYYGLALCSVYLSCHVRPNNVEDKEATKLFPGKGCVKLCF